MKKLTHDEFIEKLDRKTGKAYEVIENYIDYKTKITVRHLKCGNTFDSTPSNIMKGRCSYCSGNKKSNTNTFKTRVFELEQENYTVIGEYINSQKKIMMRHELCGLEYEVTPNNFIQGRRCSNCSGNAKKTNEEFIKEVYELTGSAYDFLEEYQGSNVKIKVKHNTCEHTYEVKPSHFINGGRCPKCSMKNVHEANKKTHNEFIEQAYNLVKNEYTFLTKYENFKEKIKIRHNNEKCNYHEFTTTPSNFIKGSRCPICSKYFSTNKKRKKSKEFFKEVYDLVKNEYIFLEDYEDSRIKIKCKHSECGYEWKILPSQFLLGSRCPHCNNKKRTKTNDEFKKEVYGLESNKYEFLEEYKKASIKIGIVHRECGHEYTVSPSNFLRGMRCPKCRGSKGERKIDKILKSLEISFVPQFKFNDCKNIRPLPFDFYLDEDNVCIEFDGRQHFEIVEIFGGEKTFKQTQINDNIKNTYCKENNIPLLRIPYWDYDNIESILEKELVKYGLINVDISK